MVFRKNISCTNVLIATKQLTEKVIEYEQRLHAAFINQENAFDRINREQLWEILTNCGVSHHMINISKSLNINSGSIVRTAVGHTKNFEVRTVV
jgi:hypothetical protein